ncbi:TPA: hypothetical protein NH480_002824 [Pseudomonas aeruginosa]|uniref:hypothetical protein n=1 Tax=Pseudomonas aeruginosa TaxID=287 RepID=UPI0021E4B3FB|nr:hypothetical protein [Pseudomonas aeruginosa]UYF86585.1 hypothetical protein LLJ53_11270 [Pseudomonas aeruginosa]HCE9854932.1 hypothetical protein [Pseudomonas aeruginosa]
MERVTNTIKSASSIIAILAISAFSFNTFASEVESNKSYSCVETATENSCDLIITNPTAEDKKLVEVWKQKVEFSTCSVETDERIECNITAYYEDFENEISKELDSTPMSKILSLFQSDSDKNNEMEISRIIEFNGNFYYLNTYNSLIPLSKKEIESIVIKEIIRDAFNVTLISFAFIMLAWFITLLLLILSIALDLLLAYAIVKLCGSKSSKEDV